MSRPRPDTGPCRIAVGPDRGGSRMCCEDHVRIADAIDSGDAALAQDVAGRHFHESATRHLLDDGSPLEPPPRTAASDTGLSVDPNGTEPTQKGMPVWIDTAR